MMRHSDSARRGGLGVVAILVLAGMAFGQARPEQHRAPYLNLSEGKTVATRYAGEITLSHARALSTAKGDFDEDGMPDLAAGFSTAGGGAVAIHRGNVGALWPYGALRGTDPPAFLPDARVFALPEAPDFLAAGDFDADGHWDIVAAHIGSNALWFLKGDGHGGFAAPRRIDLPGKVTALTSGEINRPDGLTDLIVAVAGDSGAQALVFESPDGALGGTPEAFDLPADAAALAVIPLDGGIMNGIAVGAGRELLLVHPRDRRLTRSKADRDRVPAATVTRQTFPFALRSLVVGHFTSPSADLAALGDDGRVHILERSDASEPIRHRTGPLPKTAAMTERKSIALPASSSKMVTARVAASGRDSLIVLDPIGHKLHVVSHRDHSDDLSLGVSASLEVPGAPGALEAMRINKDALRDLVVLADSQSEPIVYTTGADYVDVVTNTNDIGTGSLRWAINDANNALAVNGLTAEVDFNIPLTDPNRDPTTGVFNIQPVAPGSPPISPSGALLPWGITIDGRTQPGSSYNTNSLNAGDNAHLLVEIDGGLTGYGYCAFGFYGGPGSVVRGLMVGNFTALSLPTNGNLITSIAGGCAFFIDSDNNIIEGNIVGADITGRIPVGVWIDASNYADNGGVIGGTVPQARNLLSATTYGIIDMQIAYADTAFIQGNYIGTDSTGTQIATVPGLPIGLGEAAVYLAGAYNAVVGGTTAGAGNLISFSGKYDIGRAPGSEGSSNLIQGNLIGTDATGTIAIEPSGDNAIGVYLGDGDSDTVGGTTPTARNIISGHSKGGILANDGSVDLLIEGNYIGLDATGSHAIPNSPAGVIFGADWYDLGGTLHTGEPVSGSAIGGEAAGAGNVISGNDGPGVSILGLTNVTTTEALANFISGNLIGTDATGVNALGNQGDGIVFQSYGGGNTVGGTDEGAGNVIAYNTGNGVNINPGANSGITNNSVIGNVIYSNSGAGVRIPTGTGNRVSANSIYSNGALGIDIDTAGVLVNSACQSNTNGANLLQNAPVLTAGSGTTYVTATATDPNGNTSEFSNCVSATLTGDILDIAGTLNSLPSTTYTVEYFSNPSCDSSRFGQGQTFLGSTSVTTPAACSGSGSAGGTLDLTSADLGVTNTPTPANFAVNVPGSPPFTSVVTNAGPKAATAVVWTDVLPANVSYVSAIATQGNCGFSNQTITCNLGNLRVGGQITVSVTLTVTAVGTFSNTMSVTSSTPDNHPSNNSATASLTAKYAPYIDHLTPASVNVGSPATTVTVVGQGLMPTSVVSYNGTVYSATFTASWNPTDCGHNVYGQPATSCTALTITVPASLLAVVSSVPVTVSGASGSLTFSVAVAPGPVTHFVLSFSGNPSSVAACSMETLSIAAVDANGFTVPTYTGTVTLTTTDPASTVFTAGGGTASVTFTAAEEGTAYTFVEMMTVGTQSIAATDATNPAIKSTISTNVTYGAASNLVLSGTPQAAAPGNAFLPLGVTVADECGNLVQGQKITFTAPTSGASAILSSSTATTDILGQASVNATANGTSGTYSVGVTFGAGTAGGGDNADVFLLNNGSGLATLTATAGTAQSTFAGQLFPTKLQAQLLDGLAKPISGATVWFNSAVVAVPGSAVTDSNGSVSVTANAPSNAAAGTSSVTATAGGLTATFQLTIKTPQPVVMTASGGTPQTAAVGSVFAVPLSVTVTDGSGNELSGVVVTYIPPTSGATAVLSAGTALTNAYGVASLTATANSTQGTYNVTASVGGVAAGFVLTNGPAVVGPPASIAATAGTPQSAPVNQAFATAFQVLVKNASGIPLPGASVTFSAPATGASGTFSGSATAVTNSIGIATAPTFTANTVAGTYNVTATAGAVSTTFSLTNTGGAPTVMNFYAGNNQSATVNTAFGTALAVQLTDTYGNPAGSGYSVMFAVAAGSSNASAVFSGSSQTPSISTGSNGVAAAPTLTANGIAGAFSVTAVCFCGSSYPYQIFSLTNTAAVPSSVTAVAGTPQTANAGAAFAAPLSAKVTDSGGNPLAGFTVTFTAPSAGASATLSAPSAITNASGIATVTATANAVAGSYNVTAGIGSFSATFALTNIAVALNKCDINADAKVNVTDVQLIIDQALGMASTLNDLNGDGCVNVVEVQIVTNAVLKLGCSAH